MPRARAGARRGQFTIISAGLVAIIILATVIATFALVRNLPFQNIPRTSATINEMNSALQEVLQAAVGYYGSILQVSGNTTFAKLQTSNYFSSGLDQISRTHPQWNPTIQSSSLSLATKWFGTTSYSQASLAATYSITSIGLNGFTVTISASLTVSIQSASASTVRVQVLHENNQAELDLTASSFRFLTYSFVNSSWNTRASLGTPRIFANGSYDISIPSGVDPTNFFVQVTDPRGIMVLASKLNTYTYSFSWNSLYSTLSQDTLMIELLQNGTMRWLGQNLIMSPQGRPIPPLPVRAFRVNETIGSVNQQVPFQVEDWASSYRVAEGMSNPLEVFGSRSMIVFLVTHNVQTVTLWWDGRDIANQTVFASQDKYFTGDNPGSGVLTNGLLTLDIGSFSVMATTGSSDTTANFMRVNGQASQYGASPAYVIFNGVVRDIIQQEAEWSGGVSGAPNLYAQIVILFPANATYYSYFLRTIFTPTTLSRTLTDLSLLQLSINTGSQQTENGTSSGLPVISTGSGDFWDRSWSGFTTGWMHHFSEFLSAGGSGGGLMMTDTQNRNLYAFDRIATGKTGAINVNSGSRILELDPVRRSSVSFAYALDLAWVGAVVTFNTTPLYPNSGTVGLWIAVEYPPTITVS